MKTSRSHLVAVCAPAILFLVSAPAVPAADPRFVPGEIIVAFDPQTSPAGAANALARHGLTMRERATGGAMLVSIPDSRSPLLVSQEIALEPGCAYAHPNYLGEGGDFTPNDTHFFRQWHLDNTGQTGGTPDADIDAIQAWDISRGSSGVVVAVLDTGIDSDHPELVGRFLPGFDFVNEDANPEADHSHGPMVSGILSATADNAFGVAGVDHFATLLPVKVLDSQNGGTTFDLIQGLDYCSDQLADVVSMSLINYPGTTGLRDAISRARTAGCILIACGGNNGIGDADISWPGASTLVLTVGWTNHLDARSTSSGTGSALDVVAPGVNVRTLVWNSSADTFTTFSGCSAATPVVAGIASICLAVNPELTHDEVKALIEGGAEDQVGPPGQDLPGWDAYFGNGRVNLYETLLAAVTHVAATQPPPVVARTLSVLPSPSRGPITISLRLPHSASTEIAIYAVTGGLVSILSPDKHYAAGEYRFAWDGMGSGGRAAAPGVYFAEARITEMGTGTAQAATTRTVQRFVLAP